MLLTLCHSFRAIGGEIASLPGTANIGWLRVSAKPLKQALATWASKWVYLFTKYLQDKVRQVFGVAWPATFITQRYCQLVEQQVQPFLIRGSEPSLDQGSCCVKPENAPSTIRVFLQVMGTVSELYTFMDGADATLARKVLGEGSGEAEGGEATADGEAHAGWCPGGCGACLGAAALCRVRP